MENSGVRARTSEVKLRSNQGEIFVVEREVACRSVTIKNTVEDTDHETPVPLPIDSMIIAKVIEYCNCHHRAESELVASEETMIWDANFVHVDDETIFSLILAANYLDNKPLLDLTCMTVAAEINGKTPDEIRRRFNLKNDLTPAEEEDVKRSNV